MKGDSEDTRASVDSRGGGTEGANTNKGCVEESCMGFASSLVAGEEEKEGVAGSETGSSDNIRKKGLPFEKAPGIVCKGKVWREKS